MSDDLGLFDLFDDITLTEGELRLPPLPLLERCPNGCNFPPYRRGEKPTRRVCGNTPET